MPPVRNLTAIILLLVVGAATTVAAAAFSGCSYKKFVGQEEGVKAEWAEVRNGLQRRDGLIPDLVEIVKRYAPHEQSVFQAVADSRVRLAAARTPEETIAAANQQSTELERLLSVAGNHPRLKANESFSRLMKELASAETGIAVERMRYNAQVQLYNKARRQFPGMLTARLFSLRNYPFFEVPMSARDLQKVKLEPEH